MKTVTLCLAMVGSLFSTALARPSDACLCKKQKNHAQTAKVQSLTGSPTSAKPSAFGGGKGTIWSLAQTVRNQ